MITERLLEADDYEKLVEALSKDSYHTTTTPEFFVQPDTLTKVYELNDKPVLFARACKSLRLDLQFVDNDAAKDNIRVMLKGFPLLAKQAKENGFTEIIFNSSSPLLIEFCTKRLGFKQIEGSELRKVL